MTEALNAPNVLGIYLGHDLAACLLRGGQIAAMIEEERLNRFRHGRPNSVAGLWGQFAGKFGYFPWASVCYCLESQGLGIDNLDLIVIGDQLWASSAVDTIRQVIPIKDRNKIVFITEPAGAVHHYHHALTAFLASPFDHAAVLVIDADGNSTHDGYEAETGYLFEARDGKHTCVFKNRYRSLGVPRDGIGWTYEQVTRLLGFINPRIFLADAGKTMGLASYGKRRPEFESPWITHKGFELDFSGFRKWLLESGRQSKVLNSNGGFADQHPVSEYAGDLAFKAQSELESAMLHLANELHKHTGARNLCMAGGVALNSVANGLLVKQGLFEQVFIQPAANDAGQAIGLAYHGHLLLTTDQCQQRYSGQSLNKNGVGKTGPPSFTTVIKPISQAYGGRRYTNDEICHVLEASGLPYEEFNDYDAVSKDAAKELASSKIIGWFQGGSEYGPRALGHRSILADPRGKGTKDKLNLRVKFREPFRPFAPSVLLERAGEIFDLKSESPYMLLVADVRESWRSRVPAIVHVDGTARIQTVDQSIEPLYYALISEFEKLTDVPLVLNTSFNIRGMPIVETPYDALQCFLYSLIDCIYLERFKINRPSPLYLFLSLSPGWRMSVKFEVDTNRQVISIVSGTGTKTVELEGTDQMVKLLRNLDGFKSLLNAYQDALEDNVEPAESNGLVAIIPAVQHLVRQGALQMRVGDLVFKEFVDEFHWWQAPQIKS